MSASASRRALWLAAAFFSAVAVLAALKMCQDVDNDLFWQLKDGERVVLEGRLPLSDDFSFTVPGREMVAIEWLAETLHYLVFRASGYAGLVACHTALFLLVFAFLLALLRRRLPLAPSLCLLSLAAFAFLNFYAVRAQNWTFLLTAVFLYGAARWEDGDRRVPWAMAGLMPLWANLHAGFMVGLAVLGLLCLRRCWEARRLAPLAPWGLAALLCCAHPNGATAFVYPLWFMAAPPPGRALVLEWRPLDFGEPSAMPYLILFAFLLWLGLGGLEARFPWAALTLALAILALRSRKLLPEFTMAAAAVLAFKLGSPEARAARKALAAAAACAWAVAFWVVLRRADALPWRDPSWSWERAYPKAAVETIAARYPGRRLFHPYDWGGYLIFKLHPRGRVFIDGRLEPYWQLLPGDYTTIMEKKPGWDKLLADYNIDAALLRPSDRLCEGLSADPLWKLAYGDARSVLFVR